MPGNKRMQRHLVLKLAAPMMAFGGETIDNLGVIRDFPARSMLTGLLANALGWDRSAAQLHDSLQARLRMGCVLMPGAKRMQDFQTAQISKETGWTTWGAPEGRAGNSYDGPHLRYRDYHADLCAWVVLRLEPADEAPTLQDIATALDRPCRPLFLGRKPCLPAGRLVAGWVQAACLRDALQSIVNQHAAPPASCPAPDALLTAVWQGAADMDGAVGAGGLGVGHAEAGQTTAVQAYPAVHAGPHTASYAGTQAPSSQPAIGWPAQWDADEVDNSDGNSHDTAAATSPSIPSSLTSPSIQVSSICDERNWHTGLHGGWHTVHQSHLVPRPTKDTPA